MVVRIFEEIRVDGHLYHPTLSQGVLMVFPVAAYACLLLMGDLDIPSSLLLHDGWIYLPSIGHVVRRHTVKQMEKAQGANIGVTLACVLTSICNSQAAGAAINIAGGAVFARFSRQDEAEADAEGVKNTTRAGISPTGMVTMFQKLLEERKTRPGAVESWFLTHPLEEDRINAVQSLINAIPPGQLAGLGTDTRNFHAFKSRIQSLPPSPPPRQVQ
jgi:predicted Zn-dependent protease